MPRPPRSQLFPYTTLFRSRHEHNLLPRKQGDSVRMQHPQSIAAHLSATAPSTVSRGQRIARRRTCTPAYPRSEEHTSELQSRGHLVCRLLLEKKNIISLTC